jgi:anti-sigma regulatory factor (Ser/Thr protein kinase)
MDAIEHFALTTDSLAVRDARRRVRALGDLPPRTIADAELVVSELVANSLLHAGLGPADRIDVTLRRDRARLVIVVDDHGSFSRRPAGPPGLGLRILDGLCEHWEIERGRVTATLRLARASAAASDAPAAPNTAPATASQTERPAHPAGAGPGERPYEPFATAAARA